MDGIGTCQSEGKGRRKERSGPSSSAAGACRYDASSRRLVCCHLFAIAAFITIVDESPHTVAQLKGGGGQKSRRAAGTLIYIRLALRCDTSSRPFAFRFLADVDVLTVVMRGKEGTRDVREVSSVVPGSERSKVQKGYTRNWRAACVRRRAPKLIGQSSPLTQPPTGGL